MKAGLWLLKNVGHVVVWLLHNILPAVPRLAGKLREYYYYGGVSLVCTSQ